MDFIHLLICVPIIGYLAWILYRLGEENVRHEHLLTALRQEREAAEAHRQAAERASDTMIGMVSQLCAEILDASTQEVEQAIRAGCYDFMEIRGYIEGSRQKEEKNQR